MAFLEVPTTGVFMGHGARSYAMHSPGPAEGTKIWGLPVLLDLDRIEHSVKAPLYLI